MGGIWGRGLSVDRVVGEVRSGWVVGSGKGVKIRGLISQDVFGVRVGRLLFEICAYLFRGPKVC